MYSTLNWVAFNVCECNKNFRTKDELVAHQSATGHSGYNFRQDVEGIYCFTCKGEMWNSVPYDRSMDTTATSTEPSEISLHVCSCGAVFSERDSFATHMNNNPGCRTSLTVAVPCLYDENGDAAYEIPEYDPTLAGAEVHHWEKKGFTIAICQCGENFQTQAEEDVHKTYYARLGVDALSDHSLESSTYVVGYECTDMCFSDTQGLRVWNSVPASDIWTFE